MLEAGLLPAEPGPHDALARVFVAQGKVEDALREFRRALEVDPNHVSALEGLRALGRMK